MKRVFVTNIFRNFHIRFQDLFQILLVYVLVSRYGIYQTLKQFFFYYTYYIRRICLCNKFSNISMIHCTLFVKNKILWYEPIVSSVKHCLFLSSLVRYLWVMNIDRHDKRIFKKYALLTRHNLTLINRRCCSKCKK